MGVGPVLVLVRHGQTAWSATGRHTSSTEKPLTPAGKLAAAGLAERLAGSSFALVLSSPRARALETCRLAGFGECLEVTPDLAEWDYGDYEGRTTEEIRRESPGWTIFTHPVPGGETARAVGARADRIIARAEQVGGPVACFSHGHLLRVLGARWIGLPPADGAMLALDTASISTLGYEHDRRVLRSWNS